MRPWTDENRSATEKRSRRPTSRWRRVVHRIRASASRVGTPRAAAHNVLGERLEPSIGRPARPGARRHRYARTARQTQSATPANQRHLRADQTRLRRPPAGRRSPQRVISPGRRDHHPQPELVRGHRPGYPRCPRARPGPTPVTEGCPVAHRTGSQCYAHGLRDPLTRTGHSRRA